jgi:short-subunit dehydrogenase
MGVLYYLPIPYARAVLRETLVDAALTHALALYGFVALGTYVVTRARVLVAPNQNLKTKYDATWALVTGGSTGIGRSLAEALLDQGLNVAIAALDDDALKTTTTALRERHGAKREVRAIPVNLGDGAGAYVDAIAKAMEDVDVQCVFNNAGYMLTGFFDKQPLEKLNANHECNATSAMRITHVFVTRMLEKKLRGCVVFTSSAAACQPTPFSALYGATKAYVSSFAANIGVELRSRGVDVCAVHPSPVASRFYDNAHKLDSLNFFMKFAVKPEELPMEIFRPIGRVLWHDIGAVAVGFRLLLKLLDYGFFATLISRFAHFMGDYKKNV